MMRPVFADVVAFLAPNLPETLAVSVRSLIKSKGGSIEPHFGGLVSHVIALDVDFAEYKIVQAQAVPLVKPLWVALSSKFTFLLPADNFSVGSNSGIFVDAVVAFSKHLSANDVSTLCAIVTYNGGMCTTSLDGRCSHYVTPFHEAANTSHSIKTVNPKWVLASVAQRRIAAEELYRPDAEPPAPAATTASAPSTTPPKVPVSGKALTSPHAADLTKEIPSNHRDIARPVRSPSTQTRMNVAADAKHTVGVVDARKMQNCAPTANARNDGRAAVKQDENERLNRKDGGSNPGGSGTKDVHSSPGTETQAFVFRHVPNGVKEREPITADAHIKRGKTFPLEGCMIVFAGAVSPPAGISSVGGRVLTQPGMPHACNMVVAEHMQLSQAIEASRRNGVDLVTMAYITDAIGGKLSSLRNPLYTPTAGIYGTAKHASKTKVSVTGFRGLDRTDLELMLQRMGMEFSASLGRSTDILVAYDNQPTEKLVRAAACNIPVVTRQWVETCYTSWSKVSTRPFLLKQDADTVQEKGRGAPEGGAMGATTTTPLPAAPDTKTPATAAVVSEQAQHTRGTDAKSAPSTKPTPRNGHTMANGESKTSAADVPTAENGRRSSTQRPLQVPTAPTQTTNVVANALPSRSTVEEQDCSPQLFAGRKRTADDANLDTRDSTENAESHKRRRVNGWAEFVGAYGPKCGVPEGTSAWTSVRASVADLRPRVLVCGVNLARGIVERLGGTMAATPEECTHIVAMKIRRTAKFLASLCLGRHINADWINDSVEVGRFLGVEKYTAFPTEEKLYNIVLRDSIATARKQKVFGGRFLYVSNFENAAELKDIIVAGGGVVVSSEEVRARPEFHRAHLTLPAKERSFFAIGKVTAIGPLEDPSSDPLGQIPGLIFYPLDFLTLTVLRQSIAIDDTEDMCVD
eukprot:Opistho-2@53714